MAKHRRTRKLIRTKLQLKLTLWFVATAALCLLFQFFLFTSEMSQLGARLPGDSQFFYAHFLDTMLFVLLASLGVGLPLTFAVGVLLTFKVAGPIYRFTTFMREVKNGTQTAECRLRQGDELQDFCVLLNDVTAPLRAETRDEPVTTEAAVQSVGGRTAA